MGPVSLVSFTVAYKKMNGKYKVSLDVSIQSKLFLYGKLKTCLDFPVFRVVLFHVLVIVWLIMMAMMMIMTMIFHYCEPMKWK